MLEFTISRRCDDHFRDWTKMAIKRTRRKFLMLICWWHIDLLRCSEDVTEVSQTHSVFLFLAAFVFHIIYQKVSIHSQWRLSIQWPAKILGCWIGKFSTAFGEGLDINLSPQGMVWWGYRKVWEENFLFRKTDY